jgi:hypothetical protein
MSTHCFEKTSKQNNKMHIWETRDGLGIHETRENDDSSEDSIERS